jgi:hypothetical protein
MGENVQWIPTADASRAAIRAACRTSSGSQLADWPRGMGKIAVDDVLAVENRNA